MPKSTNKRNLEKYTTPAFANEPTKEVTEEVHLPVVVQKKVKFATSVSVKKAGEFSLEEALWKFRQNNEKTTRGRKKSIFSSHEKSKLYELDAERKAKIRAIGNQALYMMHLFEKGWIKSNKSEWTPELYGMMSSMLLDIAHSVADAQTVDSWPRYLERKQG